MKWPNTADELLAELERLAPERLPEKGESMEDYNQHVGARRLVLQLQHARETARRGPTGAPKGTRRVSR